MGGRAATEHKARIKDLARQLMPMTPLTGDLAKADLAVLERHAEPRVLLAADMTGLTRLRTCCSANAIAAAAAADGAGMVYRAAQPST